METLIGICAGTSAVLGATGVSILQWKKAAPKRICGEILKVSGARLVEVRSGKIKSTFVLKTTGEINKVKSLGFKGRIHRKEFTSISAIVGPANTREMPFTGEIVEVKESDEPIYLHEIKNETVATDSAEALERYVKAQKRNDEGLPVEKKKDDMNASDYICVFSLLGAQYIGWFGVGLIFLDLVTCKCNC